jgi:hypothetical protein
MLRYNRVNQAAPSAWLLSRVRWRRRCDWRIRSGVPLRYPDRRKRSRLQDRVRITTPSGTRAVDRVADRGHAKNRALLTLNRAFAKDRALLPARRLNGSAVLICRREGQREEILQRPRRGPFHRFLHGSRRGGVEAGLAGVLLIGGGAATTGRARSNSSDDGSTGLKSTAMPKFSHSKSESESQNRPVGCRKVAAEASISVTSILNRGSRGGVCDPSFAVIRRNLEQIDGAKETGIHPVVNGETHGGVPASGRETPRRGARRGPAAERAWPTGISVPSIRI